MLSLVPKAASFLGLVEKKWLCVTTRKVRSISPAARVSVTPFLNHALNSQRNSRCLAAQLQRPRSSLWNPNCVWNQSSKHLADLNGWVLFYCFGLVDYLYGTRVRKKRRGRKEVIQRKEVNCINSFRSWSSVWGSKVTLWNLQKKVFLLKILR